MEGTDAIEVHTTRPETLPGDVAVCVHPDDARYAHLLGKHLRHPISGQPVPVLASKRVDPAFGSGAVKITPAHDPTDHLIGQELGLPSRTVFSADGSMASGRGRTPATPALGTSPSHCACVLQSTVFRPSCMECIAFEPALPSWRCWSRPGSTVGLAHMPW
jgi:isoleucyl-tRNA synthetase